MKTTDKVKMEHSVTSYPVPYSKPSYSYGREGGYGVAPPDRTSKPSDSSSVSFGTVAALIGAAGVAVAAAMAWMDRKHSGAIEAVNRGLAGAIASAAAAEVSAARSVAAFQDLSDSIPISARSHTTPIQLAPMERSGLVSVNIETISSRPFEETEEISAIKPIMTGTTDVIQV